MDPRQNEQRLSPFPILFEVFFFRSNQILILLITVSGQRVRQSEQRPGLEDEVDFVVVGGVSSGCVLAAVVYDVRLSVVTAC